MIEKCGQPQTNTLLKCWFWFSSQLISFEENIQTLLIKCVMVWWRKRKLLCNDSKYFSHREKNNNISLKENHTWSERGCWHHHDLDLFYLFVQKYWHKIIRWYVHFWSHSILYCQILQVFIYQLCNIRSSCRNWWLLQVNLSSCQFMSSFHYHTFTITFLSTCTSYLWTENIVLI